MYLDRVRKWLLMLTIKWDVSSGILSASRVLHSNTVLHPLSTFAFQNECCGASLCVSPWRQKVPSAPRWATKGRGLWQNVAFRWALHENELIFQITSLFYVSFYFFASFCSPPIYHFEICIKAGAVGITFFSSDIVPMCLSPNVRYAELYMDWLVLYAFWNQIAVAIIMDTLTAHFLDRL